MDEIIAIEIAIGLLDESWRADRYEIIEALRRAQDLVVKGYMYDLAFEEGDE